MGTVFATIIGRLGGDPETRHIASGSSVTEISIAIDEKDRQGNKSTWWVKVTLWGKRGETFAQYHKKGNFAAVSGTMKQETWQDRQTGAPRTKMALDGKDWTFAQGPQQEQGQQGQYQGQQEQQGQYQGQQGQRGQYQPPQQYQQQGQPPQQQYQPPQQQGQQQQGQPPQQQGQQQQGQPPQQQGQQQQGQPGAPGPGRGYGESDIPF